MGVFNNAETVERIGRSQAKRVQERPPEAPFGQPLSNEDTLKLSKASAKNLIAAARMRGLEKAPQLEAERQRDYLFRLEAYKNMLEYGKKQAEWSTRPLVSQDDSDAWNERQNRLASGRMAADIMLRATMNINRLKNEAK